MFCSTKDEAFTLARQWKLTIISDDEVEEVNADLRDLKKSLEYLLDDLQGVNFTLNQCKVYRSQGQAISGFLLPLFRSGNLNALPKLLEFEPRGELRASLATLGFDESQVAALIDLFNKYRTLATAVRYAHFRDMYGVSTLVNDYDVEVELTTYTLKARTRLFDPEGSLLIEHTHSASMSLRLFANVADQLMNEVDKFVDRGSLSPSDSYVKELLDSLRRLREVAAKQRRFEIPSAQLEDVETEMEDDSD